MGWLASLIMLIAGLITAEPMIFLAASIFAVAGALEMVGDSIRKSKGEDK